MPSDSNEKPAPKSLVAKLDTHPIIIVILHFAFRILHFYRRREDHLAVESGYALRRQFQVLKPPEKKEIYRRKYQ